MAYNIYEKVNNIFSDELEDNKKLIFSPMRPFSKFSKKFQDNHFSFNLIEKSMETSADKNKSPKHRKKQMKMIKENNKPTLTQNSNKKIKAINTNHSRSSSKNILSTIKSIIKSSKEKEDKKDNDITDSGYPLNDKESKKVRGRASFNHHQFISSPYMKGIHGRLRDSKRIKISKFELDNDKNEKIEEEEEHKLNEDEKERIKDKNKKTNIIKDKINEKSSSNRKFKKNRASVGETNENVKKGKNNKSIISDSMESEKHNQSPKTKAKKMKRAYMTKSTKDVQTTKTNKIKEKIKKHYSYKKKNELLTPPINTKQNDKDISSCNSSNLSEESSSLSNKNKEEQKENKKTNNIKANNNNNNNNTTKNNNNNNISDESNFQSSIFSDDSNDNDEVITKKKITPKSNKSSKCIKLIANKELSNFGVKKYSNKKSAEYYNKSKDYKNIQEKDEESKGNSESTKKNDDKGKKINDKFSSSEVKNLRRPNSKRKLYIPSPSQHKISSKVNNLLILSDKDNKINNENKGKEINQNMNIISPGNIISIEYNINHENKNERDLEIKNNNIIINNNESNNITCYRKDLRSKNEIKERINEDDNIINGNNNGYNNGYNEYINTQNNIIKGKKKPRKKFCLCCL